jgi:hypothetical protein
MDVGRQLGIEKLWAIAPGVNRFCINVRMLVRAHAIMQYCGCVDMCACPHNRVGDFPEIKHPSARGEIESCWVFGGGLAG